MKSKIFLNAVISILLAIIYYMSLPVSLFKALPMGDTPIFEYFGYAMTKGQFPYLDLFDHKGIFIFLAHYIGFLIYGEVGVKILFSLCVLLFLWYSLKISTLFSDEILVAPFTVIIIFLNYMYISELGLNVETLVLPLITYSLYIYLKYFIKDKLTNYEIVFLGAMFFITFFTRANMITVWLLFSIILFIKSIKIKDFKFLINYISYFSLGIFIIGIPILIYSINNNFFSEMIYQSFYVNFTYASGVGIGKKAILLWLLETMKDTNIILVMVIFFITNKYKIKNYLYHYTLITIIAIFLALLSKRNYYHYLIVLLPFLIPYISIVFKVIFDKINNNFLKIAILISGIYFIYQGNINYVIDSISSRKNINENFSQVSSYIKNNTTSDDKIYTHRLTGAIYLQSERMAITKYFFIPSINEEIYYDELVEDLNKNNAKYIVLNTYYLYNSKIDKFVVSYTEKNYILEKSIGDFKIYKLK